MSPWKRVRSWLGPFAVAGLAAAAVVVYALRGSNSVGAPEAAFAVLEFARVALAVAMIVVALLLVVFVARPTFVPVVGVLLFASGALLCVAAGAFLRGEAWIWLPYAVSAVSGLAALAHLDGAFDRTQIGTERSRG